MAQPKSTRNRTFNCEIKMPNDSSGDASKNSDAYTRRAVDCYGIDRSAKRREDIITWIRNFISSHPNWMEDNYSYMLPPPTVHLIQMDEQEFPALPSATKTSPSPPQTALNYATLKFTDISKPQTNKTLGPTQKNAIDGKDAAMLREKNEKNENGREQEKAVGDRTSGFIGTLPFPVAPQYRPQNAHSLRIREGQSIIGDPYEADDEMEALIDQEKLDTQYGPWEECRCDQCYGTNKEEYGKHMQDCEDCREEYFNHTLFDGKSQTFWLRLKRKLGNREAICRLCRWKRDLAKHPFARARAYSSSSDE